MKFKFLLAPALLLSACGRPGFQNAHQYPSDLTSHEAVAHPPSNSDRFEPPPQRPETPAQSGAPVTPPAAAQAPVLRAEQPAQAAPPVQAAPPAQTAPAPEPDQPLPIFEISSLPPRDTSTETEYAPMEEEIPAAEVVETQPVAAVPTERAEQQLPAQQPVARPPITPPPQAARPAAQSDARGMEKQLLDLINAERAKQGIPPLKFNRAQSKGNGQCMGSAGHSELMAQRQRLSHDNFPRNICLRSSASAENVGYATGDESRALRTIHRSMMNSEGHRANIMNPQYNTVGLGFFYYKGTLWVTESFLRL